MTGRRQLPDTADLHIVVAALEHEGRFVGYTAVSAPTTYNEALDLWADYENGHRSNTRATLGSKGHVRHFAVRSLADPRFAPLVSGPFTDAVTRKGYKGDQPGEVKAAKAWAAEHGYRGATGGWIYNPAGQPVCQGWHSFSLICRRVGRIAASRSLGNVWWNLDRPVVA